MSDNKNTQDGAAAKRILLEICHPGSTPEHREALVAELDSIIPGLSGVEQRTVKRQRDVVVRCASITKVADKPLKSFVPYLVFGASASLFDSYSFVKHYLPLDEADELMKTLRYLSEDMIAQLRLECGSEDALNKQLYYHKGFEVVTELSYDEIARRCGKDAADKVRGILQQAGFEYLKCIYS